MNMFQFDIVDLYVDIEGKKQLVVTQLTDMNGTKITRNVEKQMDSSTTCIGYKAYR